MVDDQFAPGIPMTRRDDMDLVCHSGIEHERALCFGQIWPGVQCAALYSVVLIALLSLISRSSF